MDYLKMENDIKNIYDKMGESYITKAQSNWENKSEIDDFLSRLNGKSILDIGCGTGELLLHCFNNDFQVTGIDISSEMLKISKNTVPAAKLYEISVYDIDQLNDKYDGILATYLFVHIPKNKINKVVKSLNNLLKKDGIILIVFTNTENTNEYMVNYTLDEVSKIVTDNNFEILRTNEFNKTIYTGGVVVAKKI